MLALASSDTETPVDTSYVEVLPPPDSTTLVDFQMGQMVWASARVMIGEVLELEGRTRDAILWAQTELQVIQLARRNLRLLSLSPCAPATPRTHATARPRTCRR